jgi:hypothetical protein
MRSNRSPFGMAKYLFSTLALLVVLSMMGSRVDMNGWWALRKPAQ